MKVKRKIIEIDEEKCDGCGLCVPSCAEGAIEIIDEKAKVIADKYCDGLGACLGECPNDALKIVEREAEEFDEEAVEALLAKQKDTGAENRQAFGGGCPSAGVRTFVPTERLASAGGPAVGGTEDTMMGLTHWPIQIRLIPPTAPFLKNADLLVVADCAPAAYPGFHNEFMQGKVVMMGCPKFDDAQSYIDKFTEIFQTAGIRSVTCVYMEVPCCSGLPVIVKKAMANAGASIPLEEAIIGRKGERLEDRRIA
jgi:Pyruvate/2-oxoacid:ferredoxin oxidoreductase delta subunit